VVNLVGNAIKFTERGEVLLGVDCDGAREGEFALHLVVRDTGIGIPKNDQARIFEAFVQADGGTTAATAEPGWAWPSPRNWRRRWAAGSGSRANPAWAAGST